MFGRGCPLLWQNASYQPRATCGKKTADETPSAGLGPEACRDILGSRRSAGAHRAIGALIAVRL